MSDFLSRVRAAFDDLSTRERILVSIVSVLLVIMVVNTAAVLITAITKLPVFCGWINIPPEDFQ